MTEKTDCQERTCAHLLDIALGQCKGNSHFGCVTPEKDDPRWKARWPLNKYVCGLTSVKDAASMGNTECHIPMHILALVSPLEDKVVVVSPYKSQEAREE